MAVDLIVNVHWEIAASLRRGYSAKGLALDVIWKVNYGAFGVLLNGLVARRQMADMRME